MVDLLLGMSLCHACYMLIIRCVSIGGEVFSTLRMSPDEATVERVRDMVDCGQEEAPIALDGKAYTMSEFKLHYGEVQGFRHWCECERRSEHDRNAYTQEEFEAYYMMFEAYSKWEAAPRATIVKRRYVNFVLPDGLLLHDDQRLYDSPAGISKA